MSTAEYIDVDWHHDFSDEPVRCVSEIAADRFETRKLHYFADGRIEFAGAGFSTSNTGLGTEPVPSIDQINVDPQFTARRITRQEFETLWTARHSEWRSPN